MPDGFGSANFDRGYDSCSLQKSLIESGIPMTQEIPVFQMPQFRSENSSLQGIKPAVIATELVVIFFLLAVIAEHAQALSDATVVSDNNSSVAIGSQVFSRIEAECRSMPQGTGAFPPKASPVGLARIFNDEEIKFLGKLPDGPHVGRLTVEVYRNNCLCAGRDRSGNLRNINGAGGRVHIYENRSCTGVGDRQRTCDEAVGGRYHLGARSNLVGPQRQL